MKIGAAIACLSLGLAQGAAAATPDPAALKEVDRIFDEWRLAAHVPGRVYGIVVDGSWPMSADRVCRTPCRTVP